MARAQIKGVRELSAKLSALGVNVGKGTEQAVVAGALVLQNGMKIRAPRRTGTLRRSIHIGGHEDQAPDFSTGLTGRSTQRVPRPVVSKDQVTVYVGSDLEYAAIQEFGGEIRPVRARVLRFQVNGEWVAAKRVRIPARPYVRPAFDEDGDAAVREIGEAFRDIIRAAVK